MAFGAAWSNACKKGISLERGGQFLYLVKKSKSSADRLQDNCDKLNELFPSDAHSIRNRCYAITFYHDKDATDHVCATIGGNQNAAETYYPRAKKILEKNGFACGPLSRRTFTVTFTETDGEEQKVMFPEETPSTNGIHVQPKPIASPQNVEESKPTSAQTEKTLPVKATGVSALKKAKREVTEEEKKLSFALRSHLKIKNLATKNNSIQVQDSEEAWLYLYFFKDGTWQKAVDLLRAGGGDFKSRLGSRRICMSLKEIQKFLEKNDLPIEDDLINRGSRTGSGSRKSQAPNPKPIPIALNQNGTGTNLPLVMSVVRPLYNSLTPKEQEIVISELQPNQVKSEEVDMRQEIINFLRFAKQSGGVIHVDIKNPVIMENLSVKPKSVGKAGMDVILDSYLDERVKK
ncbi:MAG: hypothetical protein KBD52_01150 [Candidatus Pacebacteria bacterium]|nr:hypothetical protein [Candidatus Paceibacterota bacterium]